MPLATLIAQIGESIRQNGSCQVYGNQLLNLCGVSADLPEHKRYEMIEEFASKHGWKAVIRERARIVLLQTAHPDHPNKEPAKSRGGDRRERLI